jgi:hypothetical protein
MTDLLPIGVATRATKPIDLATPAGRIARNAIANGMIIQVIKLGLNPSSVNMFYLSGSIL